MNHEKKARLIRNSAGGIDLITERASGSEVQILTGKKSSSLAYWRCIRQLAGQAVRTLESEVTP